MSCLRIIDLKYVLLWKTTFIIVISVKHGFGAFIFNGTVFLILSLVAHQIVMKNISSESTFSRNVAK